MSHHQDNILVTTKTVDIPPFLFVETEKPGAKFGLIGNSSIQMQTQTLELSHVASSGISCVIHFQLRHLLEGTLDTERQEQYQHPEAVKLKSLQLSIDVPDTNWAIGFRPHEHLVSDDVKGVRSIDDVQKMPNVALGRKSVVLNFQPSSVTPILQQFQRPETSLGVFVIASDWQPGSVPFNDRLPIKIQLSSVVEVKTTQLEVAQPVKPIPPPQNLLPDHAVTIIANRSQRRFHYTHHQHRPYGDGWIIGGIRLLLPGDNEERFKGVVTVVADRVT